MASTYKSVFSYVHLYQIPASISAGQKVNVMLVAAKQSPKDMPAPNEVVERMLKQEIQLPYNQSLVLTDDFAPIEQYLNE